MYSVFDRNNKFLKSEENFNQCLKVYNAFKILNRDGLQFFLDGTGSGYSAFKESNKGMLHENWPIYNQKERSLQSIKAVSWHIFWQTGSLKIVKEYHKEVRNRLKNGLLKLKNK